MYFDTQLRSHPRLLYGEVKVTFLAPDFFFYYQFGENVCASVVPYDGQLALIVFKSTYVAVLDSGIVENRDGRGRALSMG